VTGIKQWKINPGMEIIKGRDGFKFVADTTSFQQIEIDFYNPIPANEGYTLSIEQLMLKYPFEETDNPFRYSGYQWDKETGMYYLMSRMYDPVTARFMSEDTYRGSVEDPLSLNLYTYCANEPLMYVDPSGHSYKPYQIREGVYVQHWVDDGDAGSYIRREISSGVYVPEYVTTPVPKLTSEGKKITAENRNSSEARQTWTKYFEDNILYPNSKKESKYVDPEIWADNQYGVTAQEVKTGKRNQKIAAVAIGGIAVAPLAVLAAPEIAATVSTALLRAAVTPAVTFLINNFDKILNRTNTTVSGKQLAEDVSNGNWNEVPLDALNVGADLVAGRSVNNGGVSETKQVTGIPNQYDGVKQASQYLKDIGMPRSVRKQVLESFDISTIKMDIAGNSTYGIRFYGGKAKANGPYLFDTFSPTINRKNFAIGVKRHKTIGDVKINGKVLKGIKNLQLKEINDD